MTASRRWAGAPLGRMAIVGVGQIGGSVALAARAAGAVTEVVGWGHRHETVERALALGVIDRAAESVTEAVAAADLVVLATPVRSFSALAADIATTLPARAIVFDVGSVKVPAIQAVAPRLHPRAFVACHPIAGTERNGPDAASPLLFERRPCVICPAPNTPEAAVATVEALWTAMGAEPVRMDAAMHDRVMAAGSHLPHVAAYALAAVVGGADADVVASLLRLPTTSLRDTTRVAASSATMWRDILVDNKEELVPLVERLQARLDALRVAIVAGDATVIEALLTEGKTGRDRVVPT